MLIGQYIAQLVITTEVNVWPWRSRASELMARTSITLLASFSIPNDLKVLMLFLMEQIMGS